MTESTAGPRRRPYPGRDARPVRPAGGLGRRSRSGSHGRRRIPRRSRLAL